MTSASSEASNASTALQVELSATKERASEIAKRGAELYDKFVGFVEDMNSLGNRLKQAQGAFDDASSKLSHGRGNLVGQAQKLR